jgi:hypothetical protein
MSSDSLHRQRYRVEDGRPCIDINVKQSRQLFDGRDPAPFRERDLDEDAVAYLLGATQEISRKKPLKIVVTISEETDPSVGPDVLEEGVRRHFLYEREQVERRLHEHVRRGRTILAVGFTVLFVFLTLAELVASLPDWPTLGILREGFVIIGWVAMWRPVEVLLYDWWPLIDERRQIDRILEASISVRYKASAVSVTSEGGDSCQGSTLPT